ncbi:ankyrin repeat-containing domain protein [Hypoxylon sp. NC1633]|nr:ankyrin repeat-containing domain protein [Hypoxylon sp. NC1633]
MSPPLITIAWHPLPMSQPLQPVPNASANILFIPTEVTIEIAKYLPQPDKYHMAQSCRRLLLPAATAMYEKDGNDDHRALSWACFTNNSSLLGRILSSNPCLSDYRFKTDHRSLLLQGKVYCLRGQTPVTVAIRSGGLDALQSLLHFGADVNTPDPNAIGAYPARWYPIHWAVHTLPARLLGVCLELLKQRGADINQLPRAVRRAAALPPTATPATLLQAAVAREANSTPKIYQCGGLSPLFSQLHFELPTGSTVSDRDRIKKLKAAMVSRADKIRTLLQHGVDPNVRDPITSYTPIFHVAKTLEEYVPRSLLQDTRGPERSQIQALCQDVIMPHAYHYFKILIEFGADPNISCDGTTPLHILSLVSQTYEPLINYFRSVGANFDEVDNLGRTPLFSLMIRPPENFRVLKRFIQKVANVNHQDNQGYTPLMVLCEGYRCSEPLQLKTIKVLDKSGANAALKNHRRETVYEVARLRGGFNLSSTTLDHLRQVRERSWEEFGQDGEDDPWF